MRTLLRSKVLWTCLAISTTACAIDLRSQWRGNPYGPWPLLALVIGGGGLVTSILMIVVFAVTDRLNGPTRESERWAPARWPLAVGAVLSFGLYLATMELSQVVRQHAMERAGVRAQPLIDAIRAHADETGSPPRTLADLVPRRLDAVPSTGLEAYPEFLYDCRVERYGEPLRWSLTIDCRPDFLSRARLVYFPDGDYERLGRDFDRLGAWAHVRE